MIKENIRIEIVRSSIKGLSSMSQMSAEAILSVLTKHYVSPRISIVNNLSELEMIVRRKPDLVFLGMEFILVNDDLGKPDPSKIWLTSYFEEHGIGYTGSNQTAHELERNKPLAKQRVRDAGLKTSPFYVIRQDHSSASHDNKSLAFPLFIKPTNRGGGLGIDSNSIVQNQEQLRIKVSSIAAEFRSDSLVEEYLPGREFSVAILQGEDLAEYAALPIELIAPSDNTNERILSRKVKSSNTEAAIIVKDQAVKDQVCALALNAFHALGAREYGRIDIRLDKYGVPHFLEANLIPSLIRGYGSFPKACVLNINLDYESMIIRIAKLGLNREQAYIEETPEPMNVLLDLEFAL